jgi:hypothetical protein
MLDLRLRTLSVLFTSVALALLGCSTKDDQRAAGGGGGEGGASTTASGTTGAVADASSADDAKGAGGAGGSTEGGTGGIIIVNPPSDAGPECVDGGRKAVTRIDLLFMIDNSSSMADKQTILAAAVPDMVSRLIDPVCVDPKTSEQVGVRSPDGSCAVGIPDFPPVKDIHVGIITSSLGAHGWLGVCDDPDPRKTLSHNNDGGHLVARAADDTPVTTFQNKGFLNWNPTPGSGGAATPGDIVGPFQTMVTGVGQHGCGYEAQLEAIYRFLIDPDPYDSITLDQSMSPVGVATLVGTDAALLQQRADFLRPDSLVAVIAVTDENDCSIVDGGQGYYALIPASGLPPTSVLGHGTSVCRTNPNDRCCLNCFEGMPPGCPDPAADPECQAGQWTRAEDPENLRCWDQKRRYGHDFLNPVKRYIDGFKNSQVPDRLGNLVANPLYSDLQCKNGVGCYPERDKDLVFFAGIVGVPWQDIAVDPTDLSKGLLTAAQMTARQVWQKIVGDPHNPTGPVLPSDAHMIESIAPRPGLPGPDSAPRADPIHGHEWDPSKSYPPTNADLQYACTFALNPPKACVSQADCDCYAVSAATAGDAKNPLCQDPTTGVYSTTQSGAKGYPGLRELEVLQGLGSQAIVGSVCPANSSDKTRGDYGYRPVIAAIVNRIRNPLRGCIIVN